MMTVLIALGALLAGFLIFVALKPSHFEVAREVRIASPVARIFPYLNNTALSNQWSPWTAMDPQAKMKISGPAEGVGSKLSWTDGKRLGTGSATIVESVPGERVRIKLEYVKPFEMSQDAYYFVKSEGATTTVTWKVEGKNTFLGRLMCTFMDMDKEIGGTFTKGLTDLKTLVEKAS
ncbi:MAG: SRPBCC family protein [Bdellovibrionales bacterium]|nr:SRPBCC family protein [Bdellovibrionales bacterium]